MTSKQKELVKRSFERVKPMANEAGVMFYGRLFALEPSVRSLFHISTHEQASKLMQVLAMAVSSLDRIEQLVPALEDLGSKHAAYGVRDEHYDLGGECLLWTLEQALGAEFTPEVREAWEAAYGLLTGAMKRGAMAGTAMATLSARIVGPANLGRQDCLAR